MPRSVDDLDSRPGDKPSVSYSANTATTPNAPTTGRYVNSVSDLYGADEIEVLLDEIKDLEPCSFHTEDFQVTRHTEAPPEFRAISSRHRVMTLVFFTRECCIVRPQDFEIAGSRTAVDEDGEGPQPTREGSSPESEGEGGARSLGGTVHSWDSHANYRHDLGDDDEGRVQFRGVIVYCDDKHIRSATGIVRILLLLCSAACLAGLCASASLRAPLFMLPLLARLRFMLFVTVFSLLATSLLLFLDISHMVYLFPFNWPRLNAVLFVCLGIFYVVGSSLLLHLVHEYKTSHAWVPRVTGDQLLVTSILGYICAAEAFALSMISRCGVNPYRRVVTGDEINMQASPPSSSPTHTHRSQTSAPSRPTSLLPPRTSTATPSSSKQQSQSQPRQQQPQQWPIDDHQQPCSSKHLDNYEVYSVA
ncbi:hypothetical protein B566_EDAN010674 [Ephemera danica]|nr:hypothetical protein B566_EDAN010674 [Ephemera danica]